jgi:hypothetical protein
MTTTTVCVGSGTPTRCASAAADAGALPAGDRAATADVADGDARHGKREPVCRDALGERERGKVASHD